MLERTEPRARASKRYVRTFLFSMRMGAPLSRVHFITKFAGVLIVSFVIIKAMHERHPDPVLVGLFFALSLGLLFLGGVSRWIFRSYLVVIFPMFALVFLIWVAFMPNVGEDVYFQYELYTGTVHVRISVAMATCVAVFVTHYLLTKRIFRGVVLAVGLALVVDRWTSNPGFTIARFQWLQPYAFTVSDRNLLIAATKVMGYAAMVFNTLMLVMTTRDDELTSAFHQLRVPKHARFFLSIVFRTLSLSLVDFDTIRQAQIARGVRVRERGFVELLKNVAKMAIPLVATAFQRSQEIGDALLARGFSFARSGREFLQDRPYRPLDWGILTAVVVFTVFFYLRPFNLYTLWLGGDG